MKILGYHKFNENLKCQAPFLVKDGIPIYPIIYQHLIGSHKQIHEIMYVVTDHLKTYEEIYMVDQMSNAHLWSLLDELCRPLVKEKLSDIVLLYDCKLYHGPLVKNGSNRIFFGKTQTAGPKINRYFFFGANVYQWLYEEANERGLELT